MTEAYKELANSPLMWIACAPAILLVLYQAWIFYRRSRKDAKRMGITDEQIKAAIRSAGVTSVGPCFVMLTAMLSLMLYVGAPLAWLRVDFIGSVSYELQGANFTAEGMGIELGSSAMNADFLASAAVVMSAGCIGWIIFAALFSDKMDVVNKKMAGGNAALVPVLGTGALIGVFASVTLDRLYPLRNQAFAVFASAAAMFVLQTYNKKAKKQWIREWSITICMLIGMLAAALTEPLGILPA